MEVSLYRDWFWMNQSLYFYLFASLLQTASCHGLILVLRFSIMCSNKLLLQICRNKFVACKLCGE